MQTRQRLGILAGCLVVAVGVALYAGSQSMGGGPAPPPAGSVRLGPDPGSSVAGYVASLPAQLPAPGTPVLALVQLAPETTGAAALALGATPVEAVWRVPLPRVQTALRFQELEPQVPVATALESTRSRAAQAAGADAARTTGRQQAVALAEEAALGEPACACLLALVVRGDRATLETLATQPGVRAVQAAPAGVTLPELALAPLLPEQTERADPTPDDGPVNQP
jgi:hypothetical protein